MSHGSPHRVVLRDTRDATGSRFLAARLDAGGAPGDDVLAAARRWMDANGGVDPGTALREAGLPITFGSRIGD